MWRGFGADSEPEPPAQRSYFRPRISSISGVLAMTKQRLFTSGPIKDEVAIENVAHTSAIHPVTSGPSVVAVVGGGGHHLGHISGSISGPSSTHGNLLLTDQYMLNNGLGPIGRCPSPARSSYGDVMSFSRSASARPSIDSQTAHAIYGTYFCCCCCVCVRSTAANFFAQLFLLLNKFNFKQNRTQFMEKLSLGAFTLCCCCDLNLIWSFFLPGSSFYHFC